MAHERQRDAHHGGKPHDHHQIDRDIEEDRRGHAQRDQRPEPVAAGARDRQAPAQDHRESAKHHDPPQETPFFRHGGEDEIGMRFGQVVEMALRTLVEALARETARTDGDLRLGDVIAITQRVAFGIEEGEHALLLIGLQTEEERDWRQNRARRSRTDEPAQRQAGSEHHHRPAEDDRQRRAQIGLQQHQRHGCQDQQAGRRDHADRQCGIVARENQHDGGLHQLGRLQLHEAEIEPTLAAATDEPDRLHRKQHC